MNLPATTAPDVAVRSIFLKHIQPDPNQVRREFEPEALNQLAESIKAHGVIQPIVVQPTPPETDGQTLIIPFQIIAGERRWRAAIKAGLEFIPAVIREDLSQQDAQVIQVLENLQRADLSLADTAAGVAKLVGALGNKVTAEQLGKSPAWVSKHAAVKDLPASVQTLISDGNLDSADMAGDLAKLIEISPDGWRTRQALSTAAAGTLVRTALRQLLSSEREEIARKEKWAAEEAERERISNAAPEEQPEPTAEEIAEAERFQRDQEQEERLREERDEHRHNLVEALQPILTDLYASTCAVLGRDPQRNEDGQIERPDDEYDDSVGVFLTETIPSAWRIEQALPKTVEDCKIEFHLTLPLAQLRRLIPMLAQLQQPEPPRQNTSVKDFLKACVVKKKGAKLKASDLYKAYATWCTDNGCLELQLPFNSNEFGDAIAAAKIEKVRSNGIRYVGIELKAGAA